MLLELTFQQGDVTKTSPLVQTAPATFLVEPKLITSTRGCHKKRRLPVVSDSPRLTVHLVTEAKH